MTALLTYLFSIIVMNGASEFVSMGSIEPTTFANFTVRAVSCAVPTEALKLEGYLTASSRTLDRRMQNALRGVTDIPRRLLALRYYLRRRSSIGLSWAWTREQTIAYKKSDAFDQSIVELNAVIKAFEERNPGYSLRANIDVRGIGDQIHLWNETESVGSAATELFSKTVRLLADSSWPELPDRPSLRRFRDLLLKTPLSTIPTVAVPGFSDHGRLRAFDFVIVNPRGIVAGTDAGTAASAWDSAGWTKRLKEAVFSATDRFKGPLTAPYEPWHYAYVR